MCAFQPLTTTYVYDPITAELTGVDYSDATPDVGYTYDRLGRIETVTDAVGTRTFAYAPDTLEPVTETLTGLAEAVLTRHYQETGVPGRAFAEALNARLLGAAWFANAVNPGSGIEFLPEYRGYSYDPIGNRTEASEKDPATAALLPTVYTPNALNQYGEIAPAGGGLQTLLHDEDGNLTSFAAWAATTDYTYDAENRLIAVTPQSPTTGDTKAEFLYDYLGRRVQKLVSTYTGGSWILDTDTRFLYDGWNLVEERDETGAVRKTYVWGLDLSGSFQGAGGIGGLVAEADGAAVYYVLPDANGNVGQLIDAETSTVAAHYEYDPYGNVTYASGGAADGNPFRFSTKYADDETNLVYYGYRYYSPELGRWLTKDPIGELGGKNLHAYAANDPVDLIEPWGLMGEAAAELIESGFQWKIIQGGFDSTGTAAGLGSSIARGAGIAVATVAMVLTPTTSGLDPAEDPNKDRDLNAHLFGLPAIDPRTHKDRDDINRMRLQLQTGTNNLWSKPIYGRNSTGGVTTLQVRGLSLLVEADYDASVIPTINRSKKTEQEFRNALFLFRNSLSRFPPNGVVQGGNVLRKKFTGSDCREYRIDLENLWGHNLRW